MSQCPYCKREEAILATSSTTGCCIYQREREGFLPIHHYFHVSYQTTQKSCSCTVLVDSTTYDAVAFVEALHKHMRENVCEGSDYVITSINYLPNPRSKYE
jgi:hypothetical protein